MTFLELQNEVLLYLDELDDTDVTRTVVKQALNQAHRQRCAEQDWPWLLASPPVYQTLDAGTRALNLPTDCHRVQRLSNLTRGWEYEEVPAPNTHAYPVPSPTNDQVRLFQIRGESPRSLVFFAPQAADEIELAYYRTPSALVADADLPLLPAAHHDLLVWDALLRMKAYHNDAEGFPAFREFQREAHEALVFAYGMGSHTLAGQPTYIRFIP
jgi:hypothetical protein